MRPFCNFYTLSSALMAERRKHTQERYRSETTDEQATSKIPKLTEQKRNNFDCGENISSGRALYLPYFQSSVVTLSHYCEAIGAAPPTYPREWIIDKNDSPIAAFHTTAELEWECRRTADH